MPTSDELLIEVLKLPAPERARLAHELLLSLEEGSPEDPRQVEKAWGPVIMRRLEEIRSGKVKTLPAADALREIREDLRRRREARGR